MNDNMFERRAEVSTGNPAGPERRIPLETLNVNVLFAEDREDVRTMTKKMLEGLGCTVTAVVNGKELLDTAKTGKFGVVLSDIDMPEMSGIKAFQEIRKDPDLAYLSVILYTGRTTNEVFTAVTAAGGIFLEKPFSQQELHAAIKKAVAENKNNSEQKKEIPLTWFIGIGRKDTGIMAVKTSEVLESLGGGEVLKLLNEYDHYMSNRFIGDRLVQSASEIEDEKGRTIVENAEKKIKEITGFSPKEITDKRRDLTRTYKGKQEATIAVELF